MTPEPIAASGAAVLPEPSMRLPHHVDEKPRTAEELLLDKEPFRDGKGLVVGGAVEGTAVLQMTAVLLLLWEASGPIAGPVVGMFAIGMLLIPEWQRSMFVWVCITALLVGATAQGRFLVDNHHYLIAYWCATVAIALAHPSLFACLSGVAKNFIAATFLFAAFWKVAAGQYWDGTFWESQLLIDRRFWGFLLSTGTLSVDALQHNASAIRELLNPLGLSSTVQLMSTTRVELVSVAIGWFGMAMETLIAVLFLMPSRLVSERVRLVAILAFIPVFLVIPVSGFALIILALTLAHIRRPSKRVIAVTVLGAGLATGGGSLLRFALASWAQWQAP